jgi:hypothetical protein
MFKKDNLDSIYLSSDLLTAAKAGEVHIWVDSVLKKGGVVGNALVSNSGGTLLAGFQTDKDLLFANVFQSTGEQDQYAPKNSWYNDNLARSLGLKKEQYAEFKTTVKVRGD